MSSNTTFWPDGALWWARRDEIADWALATPDITPPVVRGPAEVSGLPGHSRSPLATETPSF